jgi:hypothetical protein
MIGVTLGLSHKNHALQRVQWLNSQIPNDSIQYSMPLHALLKAVLDLTFRYRFGGLDHCRMCVAARQDDMHHLRFPVQASTCLCHIEQARVPGKFEKLQTKILDNLSVCGHCASTLDNCGLKMIFSPIFINHLRRIRMEQDLHKVSCDYEGFCTKTLAKQTSL